MACGLTISLNITGIWTSRPYMFWHSCAPLFHYSDAIMGAMASQITSLTIVHSTLYSDADQRKHQSSASIERRHVFLAKYNSKYLEMHRRCKLMWNETINVYLWIPLGFMEILSFSQLYQIKNTGKINLVLLRFTVILLFVEGAKYMTNAIISVQILWNTIEVFT